ncbi:MAG: yrrB 3 [Gemmataceae bacterium]|nr:yrrB 3 [Gemmataceae bacterium]
MLEFLEKNGFYPAVVTGVVGLVFAYLQHRLIPKHPSPTPNGSVGGGWVGRMARRGFGWLGRVVTGAPGAFLLVTVLLLAAYTVAGGWANDSNKKLIGSISLPNWLVIPLLASIFAINMVLLPHFINEVTRSNRESVQRIKFYILAALIFLIFMYKAWEVGRDDAYKALIWRSEEARKGKDCDRALALADDAVRTRPGTYDGYYERASAHRCRGEHDAAITDYTRAIEIDPQNSACYHNRGLLYRIQKDFDRAIPDYTKAIELDGTYAPSLSQRGLCYLNKNDYATALSDFNKAISLNPNLADVYRWRGETYLGLGDREKAEADFAEANRLEPK